MIDANIIPIHPGVPISLYPGMDRPVFAAGREALGTLYRAYAAIEDAERHQKPFYRGEEIASAVTMVDGCLDELRRYHATLVAAERCNKGLLASVQGTIERIEAGKRLLEERCNKGNQL